MYILFGFNECECDMCGLSNGGAQDSLRVFCNSENMLAYVKTFRQSTHGYNALQIEGGKVFVRTILEDNTLSPYRDEVSSEDC